MRVAGRIILAISFILLIAGCVLSFKGSEEKKVGANATADPVDADLARLEAGDKLTNNHLKIGAHYALYYGTVYSYRTSKSSSSRQEPSAGQSIQYAFYPIISKSNVDLEELEKEIDEPGAKMKSIPKNFTVLVKTTRFKKVSALPDEPIRAEESIQGLVINEISKLDEEEKRLIKQMYPDIDFKKVLILEDGRTPKSEATARFMWIGGIAAIVVGVLGCIVGIVMWIVGLAMGR
jgi:hypothetical protein